MKKIFKKIVALLCVLTLSVGTIQITARAVDTYAGTLSVTGAQITTKNIAYIYLKGTDTYLSSNGEDWESSAVKLNASSDDANSGIFVNGEKQSGGLLKRYHGTNNYYFAEGFTATAAGDVVTIKGTFYSQDGAAAVTYEEAHFLWNGTQWSNCYAGRLTIEGAVVTNNTNSTNFYIQGTDGYKTGSDNWPEVTMMPAADDAESGIFVGETRIENYYSAQAFNAGNVYVRLRKTSDSGTDYYIENIPNVQTGSIVTITGTFYVYSDWLVTNYDTTPIVFEKSQFQWDGTKWVDYVEVVNYPGVLSYTTRGGSASNVYLDTTDTMPTTSWAQELKALNADSGIYINGTKNADAFMKKVDAAAYYVENFGTLNAGDVMKIKGLFGYSTNNETVSFDEAYFQWDGSTWSNYTLAAYSGSLTREGAEQNDARADAIYLKGNDEYLADDTSGSWESPAAILSDDANDATSGIFINDVKQEDGTLIKYNGVGNSYYVKGFSTTPTTSDVIKIVGTFYSQDGLSKVTFEESKFQWNGTKWVDYVEVVNYPGVLSYTTRGGSASNVYLDTTDTMPTTSWAQELKALNAESGIYVNGTKMPNALMKKVDTTAYYVEGFGTLNAGDVLKIKGLFGYSTNNETVSFEEAQFQWTGSAWKNYVELASYSGSLTREGAEQNDARADAIYLKGNDEYLADDTSGSWESPAAILSDDANDATSGIFINDVKQEDGTLIKYNGVGNSYYVKGFSITPTTSDVIKIVGTFYSQDGLSKVTFEESKFQWNGSQWVDYKETINYPGTLTYESGDSTCIYFAGTDDKPLTSWENQLKALNAESGIFVNSTKIGDAYLKKFDAYKYYVGGFGTVTEGTKITIKGLFGVEGEYETVTLDEITVQYEGNCWLDCSVITSYEEGTFWLDTNLPNTATNLYLRGSVDVHEDCAPESYPAFGWETTVGTTGFYKNNEVCSGTLKNVANGGGWYLGLEGAGITEGDKLTIRGTYGYNGRYVKFAEYNLWYTADGWKTTAPITTDTEICGDANGDGELNSLDIARLKKHLADEPVTVYEAGADANGVDGVNDRDRIKIYEYILEGAVRNFDGSYAVDYYPVYLDDEEIKLGAYNGPRTSGYEDYSYTSGGTLTSTTVAQSFLNATEFARYKNAGLNTLLHEYDGAYSSKAAGIGYGVDDGNFRNYLAFAKEAGLNIYITSMGLSSYIKFEGAGNGPTSIDFNGDGNLSSTAVTIDETKYGWDYNGDGVVSASAQMPEIFYYSDNIKHRDLNSAVYPGQKMTILEADISELFEYIVDNGYQDIFKGIMMPDEPWLVAKDRYTSAINLINALAAEYGLDIDYQGCLYPSYAETDAIGSNYTTYVEAFGTARKSLMYDFYPLQIKKFIGTSNILDEEWLTNLQTVASLGKVNNYTTGITIQSSGFETSQSSWIKNYRRDPKSDADIQFQVYSSLAFGMKKINYFTYWEKQFQGDEKFTSSMVEYPAAGGTEGKETAVYGYVKNANAEITKFDHVFMDYDWVETTTVGSSSLFSGVTSANISGVTVNSSSNASIISHMYDSEKQLDGYWLVNMAEPSTSTKATLNVTFADKNKAMVYINGEETIVDLTNGVYSADLAVGEGIFIIPLNIQ